MLANFQSLLKSESIYFEEEVKDISDTCCITSNVKVLDFDKVKDEFCKIIGIGQSEKLKSVDAVFFSITRNTIYLIEMKRYTSGGSLSCADFITHRLSTLPNKVIDSVLLILSIAGYYKIDKGFYSYFLNPNKMKIVSFLLTDMPDTELLPLTLANLDKLSFSITKRVDSNILTLNCKSFDTTFSGLT